MTEVDHEKELGVPGHLTCGTMWCAFFVGILIAMYLMLVHIVRSLMGI